MSGAWVDWAMSQVAVSSKAFRVLLTLAELADDHGSALAATQTLTDRTRLSRASLFRGLGELEEAGLLMRQQRIDPRRGQQPSLFKLQASSLPAPSPAAAPKRWEVVDAQDNDGLRELIRAAHAEAWQGVASEALARTIMAWTPRAAGAALRKVPPSVMSSQSLYTHVPGAAWELVLTNAVELTNARRPWALLSTMLSNHLSKLVDEATKRERLPGPGEREDRIASLDLLSSLAGELEVSSVTTLQTGRAEPLGIEDLMGVTALRTMCEAMCAAGVDEGVAWSAIARLTTHACEHETRAASLAAKDPTLHALGFPEEVARDLLKLVRGGRKNPKYNGKQDESIFTLDADELHARVREIISRTPHTHVA